MGPTFIPDTEHSEILIIAAIRFVLAFSGLLITYIDPPQQRDLLSYIYIVLWLYTLYSAGVYLLVVKTSPLLGTLLPWTHWIDVGWSSTLVALTHGTSSIFFFGFFFALLVASFRWGFVSGLRVALTSAVLFTIVGVYSFYTEPNFELNRFMIRPTYLVVLGYMISYWGELELTFKRRIALLKEVSTFSNPRFGINRTIGWLMERLRSFLAADDCLIVTQGLEGAGHQLFRTDPHDPEAGARAQPIPADLAEQLLVLPRSKALVYNGKLRFWQRLIPDTSSRESTQYLAENQAMIERIAAQLDAHAFVSIPIRYRNEIYARLFVLKRQRGTFRQSDADFLLQVAEQVTPVIDNIRLVDRLASDAAEDERQKIARDLHDSVIQPYIGLQMGIAAVRQKANNGQTNIAQELDKLIELTGEGIADLRGYVHGLRGSGGRESNLVPSVKRFAAKFASATGIDVKIQAKPDMHFNDRLAAEVFQMVAEGLSNIRRHTRATTANIMLTRHSDHLILRIENDSQDGPASFKPRSLTERATALGGRARVEQNDGTCSAVVIEIPL
ncbi:MAG: GAF domain-containing protein [Chloroflexi bacterium]|nr:GAF domain-containing protein [Chloroflexota bacterium]